MKKIYDATCESSNSTEICLLSPKEVAAMLGIEMRTLAAWRCNDRYKMPYVKIGSRVRYRKGDVLDFIKSQTIN